MIRAAFGLIGFFMVMAAPDDPHIPYDSPDHFRWAIFALILGLGILIACLPPRKKERRKYTWHKLYRL